MEELDWGVLCLLFPHIPVIILKIMLVVLVYIARCYTCCTFLCFTGNIVPDSTRLSSGSPYGDVNQITQTSLGALRRYGPTLRLVVDHYKMTSSVVCHGGFWQCEDDVMPWVPVEEHRKITSSVVCHGGFWQCEDDVMPWVPVEEHRKITSSVVCHGGFWQCEDDVMP